MNFNDGIFRHENLYQHRIKSDRVAPGILKHRFVSAFWRSLMQCTRLLPSLVKSGHNPRWCKLFGVLEHSLPNRYHEKFNHYNQNKCCPIMARVSTKTIHTVSHIYLTTLCHCQQTYSPFLTKTPGHFVTQSITSQVVHFKNRKLMIFSCQRYNSAVVIFPFEL